MLARFLISRSLGRTSILGTRAGRRSWIDDLGNAFDIYSLTPKFDEDQWESGYTAVIESMVEFAGNAGQVTLLTEIFPDPAKQYCRINEEDYDPDAFVSWVRASIGDTYFYAINEIIEECSLILQEVWDQAKQSFMEGLFSQSFGTDIAVFNRTFRSSREALGNYNARAAANGYRSSSTAAGRSFNRDKNRQFLIQRFGTGPTRAFGGSASGMESTPGYAEYQRAAARNGIILRP